MIGTPALMDMGALSRNGGPGATFPAKAKYDRVFSAEVQQALLSNSETLEYEHPDLKLLLEDLTGELSETSNGEQWNVIRRPCANPKEVRTPEMIV